MGSYIVLSIFIFIILIIVFKKNNGDFVCPSVVFPLVFFVGAISSCFVAYKYNLPSLSTSTFIILLTGIVTFCVSNASFLKNNDGIIYNCHEDIKLKSYENYKYIRISLFKSSLIIILNIFIVIWLNKEVYRIAVEGGYNGKGNIMTYYRLITSYSTKDVDINGILNQLIKLASCASYIFIYVFLHNLILKRKIKLNDFILLIPIGISIYTSLMSGGRSGLIGYVVMILFIAVTLLNIKSGWKNNFGLKKILFITVAIVVAIYVFYLTSSFVGRHSDENIFDYFLSYFGESFYNFDLYLSSPPEPNAFFGKETLSGIYNITNRIGFTDYNYIIHLEFRLLPDGSSSGNVYTFFRRLIQDYTLFGMYIFTFIIGFIYNYIYNKKIKFNALSDKTIFFIISFAYFYRLVFLASFDQTIFVYLSVGSIVFLLMLKITYFFLVEIQFERGSFIWKKYLKA